MYVCMIGGQCMYVSRHMYICMYVLIYVCLHAAAIDKICAQIRVISVGGIPLTQPRGMTSLHKGLFIILNHYIK